MDFPDFYSKNTFFLPDRIFGANFYVFPARGGLPRKILHPTPFSRNTLYLHDKNGCRIGVGPP